MSILRTSLRAFRLPSSTPGYPSLHVSKTRHFAAAVKSDPFTRASFPELSKRKIKPRGLIKPKSLEGGDGICAAYCAQSPISISLVSSFFESRNHDLFSVPATVEVYPPDVVHVPLTVREGTSSHHAHTFFFSSGAAVFWGVPLNLRRLLLKEVSTLSDTAHVTHASVSESISAVKGRIRSGIKSASEKGVSRDIFVRMDDFDHEFIYNIDERLSKAKFRNDEICLSTFSDTQQLLALSHGLAQSVKLLIHEEAIDVLVMRTRSIPEELATMGRTGMSQKDIKKLIGELLAARYSVNLVSDILDTPEFFWQNPELEGLYLECANVVELRQRARILETRVQVIKEALDMLNNELSSSSSMRVERAILVLIAVEVCLELTRLLPMP